MSTDRTEREQPGAETIREPASEGTIRDEPESGAGDARLWGNRLPEDLARRFEIVGELPTRGNEADLYIVCNDAGCPFVAKIYRSGILPKEEVLAIMQRAASEHVVRLEDYGESSGRWWELQEYIEHSSLTTLIETEGPQLSRGLIRDILKQLNDALKHLHQFSIEHRDLKPDNVLVRTRQPLDLVLIDFGIASVMDMSERFTDMGRTLRYAPPESVGGVFFDEDGQRQNKVVVSSSRWDYWSLGIMLVEMLTGRHPYARFNEATIVQRLATQNFEDLVEDVADEGWRKLCRGLLRRDPAKRWGAKQVDMWLADEHDSRLIVEIDPSPATSGAKPLFYLGQAYTDPGALAAAFRQDWGRAREYLARGNDFQSFVSWLRNDLGLVKLADDFEGAEKDPKLTKEARTFVFVEGLAALAPDSRMEYEGLELTSSNVKALAKRAASGDRSAKSSLRSIYENDILGVAGPLEQDQALSAIAGNWNDAVTDYRSKLKDVERNGASPPSLKGDTLITLLAAATPVPTVVNDLRTAAQRATTADARACSWFRNLGSADTASIGSLMIIPHVIAEAEAGAKKRRYDAALQNYGGVARMMLSSARGLLAGIATSVVPGFIVYWPITWIWGEKSAVTLALWWIAGCTIYGGAFKRIDVLRFVGSEKHDHSEVRIKGILYSVLGATVIGVVLYNGIPEVQSRYARIAEEKAELFELEQRVVNSFTVDDKFIAYQRQSNGEKLADPFSRSDGSVIAACPIPTSGLWDTLERRRSEIQLRFRCRVSGPEGSYYDLGPENEYTYEQIQWRDHRRLRPGPDGYGLGEWKMQLSVYKYSSIERRSGQWREISSAAFQMNR